MTSRDRVIRTLNHQPVDRAPRDLWATRALELARGDELAEMRFRYPNDLLGVRYRSPQTARAKGTSDDGEFIDAWGCGWKIAEPGAAGQLKHAPLADLADLAKYHPPRELLDKAGLATVNRGCAATSQFVLGSTEVRPLQRAQFLHGTEATFVDLGYGTKALRDLLAMLHEFFCEEMRMWAAGDVDGAMFQDPWGGQTALLVAPGTWRDLFKPLYRDYCAILHEHDKFAFFRSDGNIADVFDDLVEIGVDAVHADLFSMNVESLAEQFRDRITFWGDVDRRPLAACGKTEEVRASVRRVRSALDFGRGGVIAQCQWAPEIPFGNVAAVFEEWLTPLPMHVQAKSPAF